MAVVIFGIFLVADMRERDTKDIIAGGVLVLGGSLSAFYALTNLRLGVINQMGPGMFPASVSIIIACLGIGILVPALFRKGELPQVELRPMLAILASIFVFAITIRTFGLIASVILSTILASAAESEIRPVRTIILGLGLALLTYLVFSLGLRVQVPLFAWPW